MKLVFPAILLAILPSLSHSEPWHGPDKNLHLAAGLGISLSYSLLTDKPRDGFLVGCGVGVAKELYDAMDRANHSPSAKDALITCAGAALGSTSWRISRNRILYKKEF